MKEKSLYRFKIYTKNNPPRYSEVKSNKPESLFDNFEGNIDWEAYNNLYKKDMTTSEVLLMAKEVFSGYIPDFYRIEIVKEDTDEVIDYLGDPVNLKPFYRFKFYYKDGTSRIMDCRARKPEELYLDFDGLMDWDEYDNLSSKNMTTHEVLEMASIVYKEIEKAYYRIEIINDKTNEVIDYIDDLK